MFISIFSTSIVSDFCGSGNVWPVRDGDGGLQGGGGGVLDLFSPAAVVRSQRIWWICRWSQVECRRRPSSSPLLRAFAGHDRIGAAIEVSQIRHQPSIVPHRAGDHGGGCSPSEAGGCCPVIGHASSTA